MYVTLIARYFQTQVQHIVIHNENQTNCANQSWVQHNKMSFVNLRYPGFSSMRMNPKFNHISLIECITNIVIINGYYC